MRKLDALLPHLVQQGATDLVRERVGTSCHVTYGTGIQPPCISSMRRLMCPRQRLNPFAYPCSMAVPEPWPPCVLWLGCSGRTRSTACLVLSWRRPETRLPVNCMHSISYGMALQVTCGGLQSAHTAAVAVAAAELGLGLRSHLLVRGEPPKVRPTRAVHNC